MKELDELLEQDQEYGAYLLAKDKISENLKYLEGLFDLEITTEYTKEEKEFLDKLSSYRGTKYDWLPGLLRDALFHEFRDNKEYNELISRIKDKISKIHKEKRISLEEKKWTPVELDHPNSEFPKVKVALSFDDKFFRIRAEVKDTHFLDGNRSWRYGDGFYINFVIPNENEKLECFDSNRFYGLGFSLEDGKPQGVLVNHNGTFYLKSKKELTPKIKINEEKMLANYEIKIPFSFLTPFDPLVDEISGLNIRYTSQIDEATRERLVLIDDSNSDSELTNYRKFVPVKYNFSKKSKFKMAGLLNTRLIKDNTCKLKVFFYLPDQQDVSLKVQITNSKGIIVEELVKEIVLNPGKNIIEENLLIDDLEQGLYKLNLTYKDNSCEQTFFKIKHESLKKIKDRILSLKKLANTILLKNSIHTLMYRYQELEELIKNQHPRDDPKKIEEVSKEIADLIVECKENKSIYNKAGYVLSSIKSSFDDSFQPYSMVLPTDFDPKNEYSLMIGLHGSGVDEVGFINSFGEKLAEQSFDNMLLIGPRGRDLSDCYIGQTEFDVVDIINEIKQMFKIKKTIVFGFSMGGYGTWRMTFLHPELFDAAVIAAGFPHFDGKAENDMRNYLGRSKEIDYLVIHGTADRSVTIKDTDEFIKTLKENGYKVKYVRLEGQDHGNLDINTVMGKWLLKFKY